MSENTQQTETKKVCAILLDTKSIQKYIFSSNKLKLNIAASYLVRTIFDEIMPEVLKGTGLKMPKTEWNKSERIEMATDKSIECEIAYAGGGNMLILVNKGDKEKNEETAKEIVKKWTRELLLRTPGLKTGAAIGEINLSSQISNEEIKPLFTQLKKNQNEIFPNVKLPYTGLTVECAYTGDSADYYYDEKDSKSKYFSAEAISKLENLEIAKDCLKYEDGIKQEFTEIYKYLRRERLRFTDSIEDLGQQTGEEYVAIVHIDGNNMGVKFNDCKTLQDRKKKSLEISRKTRDAFNKLIKQIVKEYDYLASNDVLKLKKYLPIRPIIIGGDDITFVCPAKTAVIFAKRFMEYLYEGNDGFSSCAGIVIIPTKYPFFRAYQLAEELCGAAKKESREKENPNDSDEIKRKKAKGSSWLDFAILHGEQEASLEQIRQNEYTGALGDMHFGPYYVKGYTENPKNNEKNIEKLIRGALALDKMPKNKVKLLRDIIGKDKSEIKLFVEQLEHLGQQTYLESANEKYAKNIWINNETPYLDMIELMDFIYEDAK